MLPIKAIDKIVRHIDLGQSVRWSTCAAACAPLVTRLILLATAPSHLAAAARNFRYFNSSCRRGHARRPAKDRTYPTIARTPGISCGGRPLS